MSVNQIMEMHVRMQSDGSVLAGTVEWDEQGKYWWRLRKSDAGHSNMEVPTAELLSSDDEDWTLENETGPLDTWEAARDILAVRVCPDGPESATSQDEPPEPKRWKDMNIEERRAYSKKARAEQDARKNS